MVNNHWQFDIPKNRVREYRNVQIAKAEQFRMRSERCVLRFAKFRSQSDKRTTLERAFTGNRTQTQLTKCYFWTLSGLSSGLKIAESYRKCSRTHINRTRLPIIERPTHIRCMSYTHTQSKGLLRQTFVNLIITIITGSNMHRCNRVKGKELRCKSKGKNGGPVIKRFRKSTKGNEWYPRTGAYIAMCILRLIERLSLVDLKSRRDTEFECRPGRRAHHSSYCCCCRVPFNGTF